MIITGKCCQHCDPFCVAWQHVKLDAVVSLGMFFLLAEKQIYLLAKAKVFTINLLFTVTVETMQHHAACKFSPNRRGRKRPFKLFSFNQHF